MKFLKTTSVILFSLFFMSFCMPHLNAKHHYHKHRSRSSSFALNLNVDPFSKRYVERNYTTYQPAYQPAYPIAYQPIQPVEKVRYYTGPASYYSSAPVYRQVVVERPIEKVYVYPTPVPNYSYWGY